MAQGNDARFALLGDGKYPDQITGGAKHHYHLIEFAHQFVPHNVADQDRHADAHEENRIDDAVNDDVPAERDGVARQEKQNQQKKNHQAEHDAAFDCRTPEQQTKPLIAPRRDEGQNRNRHRKRERDVKRPAAETVNAGIIAQNQRI